MFLSGRVSLAPEEPPTGFSWKSCPSPSPGQPTRWMPWIHQKLRSNLGTRCGSTTNISGYTKRYCWWKKSCNQFEVGSLPPSIYKLFYIPGGAGFLPSTVLQCGNYKHHRNHMTLPGGTLSDFFKLTFQSNNSIQFFGSRSNKKSISSRSHHHFHHHFIYHCAKLPILRGSNNANVWWIWVIVHCLGWYYGWWKKSCTNW